MRAPLFFGSQTGTGCSVNTRSPGAPPARSLRLNSRTPATRSSLYGLITVAIAARSPVQPALDDPNDAADAPHPVDLLGLELEPELFLEREDEAQMLHRIPDVEILRRGLVGEEPGVDDQHVGRDGTDPFGNAHRPFPRSPRVTRIHSGQAIVRSDRSRAQTDPGPSWRTSSNPWSR